MKTFRTHYDNLKVSRDAPDFVIRAAYKALTQHYHPDKNPGDARAVRVMTIINRSYDVLCDVERRRRHDDWIRRLEAERVDSASTGRPTARRLNIRSFVRRKTGAIVGNCQAATRGMLRGLVRATAPLRKLIDLVVYHSIGVGTGISVLALLAFAYGQFG